MFANSHFALATHVLVALALHGGPLNSTELAHSINTNPAFVRALLGRLRKAGLIEVTLGKHGGAALARSAARLTLADVYHAVERRPPARMHRCEPNEACLVGRNIVPVLESVVDQVEAAALAPLGRTTIAALVDQVRRRG